MGVYSPNMLVHWPEQFRQFTYFNMIPKINSGYSIDPATPPKTIWGVLQNNTTMVKESNGNLVSQSQELLWTDEVLTMGYFVQFGEVIFRIVPANDWENEGGFSWYNLERLVGDNGTPIDQTFENGSTQI